VAAAGSELSADDAAILALESEAIAGHTLKLCLLEPRDEPLDLEALRASVAARLAGEPAARMRVERAGGRARWVADERFEIVAHVGRREVAPGLDEDGLRRVAGELMAERLDHERPLWRVDLVGPLADGREAVVARIHHAMADGISTVRFLGAVLWDGPAPARSSARPRGAGPVSRASPIREAHRLPGAIGRELGGRVPDSPLDRPIGAGRELALTSAPLAELRRIGSARPRHATVNDVLLAAVAGGLGAWLGADHRLPRLRAQVPVSLHQRDADPAELGNRDSFLNVDLPLAEPDPLARLDAIRAETAKRKRLGDADELYDFFHALARFKHVGGAAERLAASPREFSLSISNVPGPPVAIEVLGRAVERLHTAAEPADHHALRASAISCAGELGICLCTDPEALPGVAALAEAIDGSLAELRRAAIE
jgi:hypothetical protein